MSRRERGFVVLVALLCLVIASPVGALADPLPVPLPCDPVTDPVACLPLDYQIVTAIRTPDGDIPTTVDAKVGIPAPVDVDHNPLTGLGGADVLFQLQVDAGRATVRVSQLPNAPVPLPLAAQAVLADPRGGSLQAYFGYDALTDTAPSVYDATLSLAGTGQVTAFTLDVHDVAPGSTLGVVAGVYEPGPNGERTNPQQGRVDFTPVPDALQFAASSGSTLLVGPASARLISDIPTTAVVKVESVGGGDATTVDATIDQAPQQLLITLSETATGQRELGYHASAAVHSITASVTSTTNSAISEQALLDLTDVPIDIEVVQDSPTHTTGQASGAIGLVTAGFSRGGPVQLLDEPAFAYLTDQGSNSVAFRVPGLSAFELGTADPLVVGATLSPTPFHVLVLDGTRHLEGRINDLPSQVRLTASLTGGTISYTGSAVVGSVTLDATDPAGLSGRATALHLILNDLPTTLSLAYSGTAGTVSLDAGGQTLGLIEVQLTSGPDERVASDRDGILLHDVADHYVLFGRVTSLQKVVGTVSPPSFDLHSTGGRVFVLDLLQHDTAAGKDVYVRGTLDHLVDSVQATLTETATSQQFTYTASAPTNSLTLDTNSGDRWNLHASIAGPLPASVSLCQADNASCNGVTRAASAGSVKFVSNADTTVNLFDCVRPNNATCSSSTATEFTNVNNLRLQYFAEDADSTSLGDSGHIFLDTQNHTMSGQILSQSGGGGGFDSKFGAGFKALNRDVKWSLFGLSKTKTGSISCTSGTSFRVRVFGIWIGVNSFLC